jgi:enediyne polyketide synthase
MHIPDEANIGSVQAVAIVGAALRFPGASDPSSFHELTVAGRRMFREFAHAADNDGLPDRGGPAAGLRSLRAALLDDEAGTLGRDDDDLTGGITARHLLAAEMAAAALADVPPAGRVVTPARIGLFIADLPEPGTADVREWVRRQLGLPRGSDAAGPPAAGSPALGRDAYNGIFKPAGASIQDLIHGAVSRGHSLTAVNGTPSVNGTLSVNGTGVANGVTPGGLHCSLRAIAEACEALNSGEFDLVLAGGVAKGIGNWMHGHTAAALADEHIRVYDVSPTGTLPGEGCGIVALARAADARAAEVPAYAEIAGWHAAGPATPQRAVLPAAYLRAGVDPADIQFVEGHGAATATDDLAELSALLEVLGPRARGAADRCALGSVSANIGDTRAAAGVAALLKTAFAMTADIIPPSTGCVQPNRLLRTKTTPFRLPAAPEPWPQTPVQLAAVNTLGTALYPDAPRSGPVHVVLRRERDPAHRPGRRRKPPQLTTAS